MFLAVDIGNTHIVLGLFEGEELTHTWRVSSDPSRTEDEYRAILLTLFAEREMQPGSVEGCVICSVIPRLTHTLSCCIERLLGTVPISVHCEMDLGLDIRYRHPRDVGPDRLANAVGGVARYGMPLIVVDSGTATTFDVVSADRAYLGGIIMPGMEMGADALFRKTSLLPRIAIEAPQNVIGRSTFDAIASGLVWGTVGAIDRLAELVRAEIGAPDCPVIATGGYAETLGRLSNRITRVDMSLTLFGIREIWCRNR